MQEGFRLDQALTFKQEEKKASLAADEASSLTEIPNEHVLKTLRNVPKLTNREPSGKKAVALELEVIV
ncbi:hypothetical protein SK128_006820 [Halocaridina rubra]|uniref:Uncharacterized protein n=1 Tax=Halocaridina rubra TaxID=373956 RepID=A0AAN8WLG0_HALRR